MSKQCPHGLAEQDIAMTRGLCPLCQFVKVGELQAIIVGAIPALEAAVKENRECLGLVAPPVDREGVPACEPWPVIDEMLARFREAVKEIT